MGFFWAAHGRGAYLSHISYIMKLGIVISYLKKIQKYINHVTHPLSSAEMSIISPEIRNLFYQEIQTAFYYIISTSFKGCFNKHICNFDDASKFGFSRPSLNEGILKLRFWRNNFFGVTNKILSLGSELDVVMWQKIGNFSIPTTEVIITSNL